MTLSQNLKRVGPAAAFVAGLALVSSGGAESGVRLLGFALLVGFTLWGFLKVRSSKDEVVRAANNSAMAWGAPIGLGLAFLSIFGLRYSAAANQFVSGLAENANAAMAPSAAAFSLGVFFSCGLVAIASTTAWCAWWFAKR